MLKQLFLLVCLPLYLLGQTPQDLEALRKAEAELTDHALLIAVAPDDSLIIKANYTFIPDFVKALKIPGSFNYPFDSLRNISILYPEDRSFRIMTWQMALSSGKYRYFGAIQYPGDQLKLTPLIDFSDSLFTPQDTMVTAKTWFGAFYYKILQEKHKGDTYYTLIGYDGNDLWSHKKIIDVLHFENGEPRFGAPIFEVDSVYLPESGKPTMRYILEYKADATVSCNYDEKEKMIIYDHLVPSENVDPDIKFTDVPDGAYDGLKWEKGKWVHKPNVYNMSINRKHPPGPNSDN